MKPQAPSILLGFSVPTGDPVTIPYHHLMVSGLTNRSGKSTALEALANRCGLTVLAFVTKPGEETFTTTPHRHRPFFRPRADWQFVQAVLESTMRERMRFERAWIIRASKGAKSLRDVQHNIQAALADPRVKGLSRDVYTTLEAYFDIVIPAMDKVDFHHALNLVPDAVNVMDLRHLPDEVQMLVIAATLEEVHGRRDVVSIIPEAWKFLPEGRKGPVQLAAERIARQGAASRNLLWLDSQDITGVSKGVLKSMGSWLLGKQREKNEVERTLEQVPLPRKERPKVEDVMRLGLGQFYVCAEEKVTLAYVWPSWMPEEDARSVAMGDTTLGVPVRPKEEVEDLGFKEQYEQAMRELEAERAERKQIEAEVDRLREKMTNLEATSRAEAAKATRILDTRLAGAARAAASMNDQPESQGPVAPESGGPVELHVTTERPSLTNHVNRPLVETDESKATGRLATLLLAGIFDKPVLFSVIAAEHAARGWPSLNRGGNSVPATKAALQEFARWHLLRIAVTPEGETYTALPRAKDRVQDTEAK